MTETVAQEPEPDDAGADADLFVPPELLELAEVLEWEAAVAQEAP